MSVNLPSNQTLKLLQMLQDVISTALYSKNESLLTAAYSQVMSTFGVSKRSRGRLTLLSLRMVLVWMALIEMDRSFNTPVKFTMEHTDGRS